MHAEAEAGGYELVQVRVDDLRLAARIGAHPHEMDRRQTLRVGVILTLKAPTADRLDETVDYGAIVERAEVLADRHIALIETFGRELGEACLRDTRVLRAEIVVEKPGALANGIASIRLVLEQDR